MSKFILSVLDSMMLFIAEIDQAVIGLKAVRIHDRFFIDLFPDNGQMRCGRTLSDNLGMDFFPTFYLAEHVVLSSDSATANTSNPANTKMTFNDLSQARLKTDFRFHGTRRFRVGQLFGFC